MKRILIIVGFSIMFFSCLRLDSDKYIRDNLIPPNAVSVQHIQGFYYSFYIGDKKYLGFFNPNGLYGNDVEILRIE